MKDVRTFLVIVRLSVDDLNSTEDRIRTSIPKMHQALRDLSGDEVRPFITSQDALVCSWILRARCRARDVYAEILRPGSSERGQRYTTDPTLGAGDAMRPNDQIAVFEVGDQPVILNQDVVRSWLGRSLST